MTLRPLMTSDGRRPPLRIPTFRRVLIVTAAAGAALVGGLAAPAAAHVTVHADTPTPGATDAVLTFRVPDEQPAATVTRVQVQLPTNPPLIGVLVRPHAGWASTVTTTALATPEQSDDGPVTRVVSGITWTAGSPAAGIPAGGYDDFDVAVGQLPTVSTLTFKAVQTYSNGQVARWIAPTVAGQPEPADPAPTLRLTPAASGATATGAAVTPGAAAAPAGTSNGSSSSVPAATTVIDTSRDTTARVIAVAALVLALLGTAAGFVVGRRTRTGPPPPDGPGSPDLDPTATSGAATAAPGAGGGMSRRGTAFAARITHAWDDAARTDRALLGTAGAGSLAAAAAAFLPWVTGALSDRGAPLLTVHKYGVTNPLRGRWTLLLAAVAVALLVMLATHPAWHTRALILAADGLGITLIALSGRHDGASVARQLIHHKIGTGEIVNPTASYATSYGWWITLTAGLVITAAALGWYTRAARRGPGGGPAGADGVTSRAGAGTPAAAEGVVAR
jgi:uncharacterized protein YcnI